MIKYMCKRLLIVPALCAAAVIALPGCDEEEVFTVSQEEELERFITDSEEGRELFRIHDLVAAGSYTYPNNDTVYTDSLISSSRNIVVMASRDSLIDLDVGTYFYGVVTVRDEIIGRTRKEAGGQTVEHNFDADIERRAFMIKLGDNSQAYAGWVMYGYDGGYPIPAVKVISPDADTFAVTYNRDLVVNNRTVEGYLDINDIFLLNKGEQLVVSGCVYNLSALNYETTGSYTTDGFTHPHTTGTCVTDTITTATISDRFFNTVFIRTFSIDDGNTVYYNCSFVPYKLIP